MLAAVELTYVIEGHGQSCGCQSRKYGLTVLLEILLPGDSRVLHHALEEYPFIFPKYTTQTTYSHRGWTIFFSEVNSHIYMDLRLLSPNRHQYSSLIHTGYVMWLCMFLSRCVVSAHQYLVIYNAQSSVSLQGWSHSPATVSQTWTC